MLLEFAELSHDSTQNFNKAHADDLPYAVVATVKLWEIVMFVLVRRSILR